MQTRAATRALIPILFATLTLLSTQPLQAQDAKTAKFPTRPITVIVPLSAGNPADVAVRLLAKPAEKYLGEPIVVANKPGGGGTVGAAAIAAAKPDGYTIGYPIRSSLLLAPYLEKVPYHPIRDLKQIMQFGFAMVGVAVKSDSPFKSFKDVIAYARLHPGKLTYGSLSGTSIHGLAMEQVAEQEKVEFIQIPFKGTAEVQTALLGGHVLVGVGDFNYGLIRSGQLRLLLLLNEEHAKEFYPGTPILKDLGYNIPTPSTYSLAGPKDLPETIVKVLEDAFTKAMKDPNFIKGMNDLRLPIVYRNSQQLTEYITFNYEYYGKLLKEKGLIGK